MGEGEENGGDDEEELHGDFSLAAGELSVESGFGERVWKVVVVVVVP